MTKRRIAIGGFIALGLLTMSIGIVAARSWAPPNPYNLSPGIREEGAYTMIVPGTYGRLIPILPFPYTKDEPPKDGGVTAQSGSAHAQTGPITIDGKKPAPARPITGIPMGGPKSSASQDPGVGNLLTPTAGVGAGTDTLDSHLRDTIHKLYGD